MINNITQNKSTNGLIDVYYTPVSTTFLAESIVKLIALDFSGVVNVASNSPISKYDFLVKVASLLGKSAEYIAPIALSKLKLIAPRPQNMSLDNSLYLSLADENMIEVDEMIKQELKWIN
jgi:dTDP-4-dehydrorhamnose reductase